MLRAGLAKAMQIPVFGSDGAGEGGIWNEQQLGRGSNGPTVFVTNQVDQF